MQGSSATLRPRQRTTTSCTECRRRKQRCNQAKTCSNCLRRYPPVVCTYETSRRASPVDSLMDLSEGGAFTEDLDRASTLAGPSYQTMSPHLAGSSTTPNSSVSSFKNSQPVYPSIGSSNSYPSPSDYPAESRRSSISHGAANGVVPTGGVYFPTTSQNPYNYSSNQNYNNIFIAASDPQQIQWLSTNGSTGAFANSVTAANSSGDLPANPSAQQSDTFFFCDLDTGNQE